MKHKRKNSFKRGGEKRKIESLNDNRIESLNDNRIDSLNDKIIESQNDKIIESQNDKKTVTLRKGFDKSTVSPQDPNVIMANQSIHIKSGLEMHQVLNAVDIYKDAIENPSLMNDKSKVEESIFRILGINDEKYKKLLNARSILEIKESIFKGEWAKTLANVTKISLLKNPVLKNTDKSKIKELNAENVFNKADQIISENFTYAFVDAATNPGDYSRNIKQIETPASYIDPGTRSEGMPYPKANIEIIDLDLSPFGFKSYTFSAKKKDYGFEILIKKNGSVFIKKEVNRHGNTKDNDKLFLGNFEKNTFIRGSKDKTEIEKRILAKELGDTLQVILIAFFYKNQTDFEPTFRPTNSLAFTGDSIFAARCRLLGVPVLYKLAALDKTFRSCELHTPILDNNDLLLANFECAKQQTFAHNSAISIKISSVIANNCVSIGSEDKNLNNKTKDFLREIADSLNKMNERIIALKFTEVSEEVIDENIKLCKIDKIKQCKAFDIFSSPKKSSLKKCSLYKPYAGVKSLFHKENFLLDDMRHDVDIKFIGGFASTLNVLVNQNDDSYDQSSNPPRKKQKFGGTNLNPYELEISEVVEEVYSIFYNYISVSGIIYVNEALIRSVYFNESYMDMMSYADYLKKIADIKNNILSVNVSEDAKNRSDITEEFEDKLKQEISNYIQKGYNPFQTNYKLPNWFLERYTFIRSQIETLKQRREKTFETPKSDRGFLPMMPMSMPMPLSVRGGAKRRTRKKKRHKKRKTIKTIKNYKHNKN